MPFTDAMSGQDLAIEFSINNTLWSDISGTTNSIDVPEQTVRNSVTNTFAAPGDIVTDGKFESIEVTVQGLYTEEANDLFEVIRACFRAKTRIYLRWAPKGKGATGRFVFTTSNDNTTPGACLITAFTWPGAAAGSADAIPAGFKIRVPFVIKTATGSSTGLGS